MQPNRNQNQDTNFLTYERDTTPRDDDQVRELLENITL